MIQGSSRARVRGCPLSVASIICTARHNLRSVPLWLPRKHLATGVSQAGVCIMLHILQTCMHFDQLQTMWCESGFGSADWSKSLKLLHAGATVCQRDAHSASRPACQAACGPQPWPETNAAPRLPQESGQHAGSAGLALGRAPAPALDCCLWTVEHQGTCWCLLHQGGRKAVGGCAETPA